jgi:hypothetical protein
MVMKGFVQDLMIPIHIYIIQNLDTYFENARKEYQEEPGNISRMPEKTIRN